MGPAASSWGWGSVLGNEVFYSTLDGDDSPGADSGRLRGGTGGGTGPSSVALVKLIDDTDADPVGGGCTWL